jgi:Protein of unknown function (DUF3987)
MTDRDRFPVRPNGSEAHAADGASNTQSVVDRFSGNGDSHHLEEAVPNDVLRAIEFITFVWLAGDDVEAAKSAVGLAFTFDCCEPDDLTKTVVQFSRRIVIVTRDDELEAPVQAVAQKCIELGGANVSIWPLPGFGPLYPTMAKWCERYDLTKAIVGLHYGKYENLVPCGPKQESPEFTADWEPIDVVLAPVPKLEEHMIPAPLRGWVADVARRAHIPIDYAAASAICSLSSLVGSRLAVRPKRLDRWLVVPVLWGAAVGKPGALKSPQVEEGLRPLKRLAVAAAEKHAAEMTAWRADKMVIEIRKEEVKKALRKEVRTASKERLSELAHEADGGEAEPREHRYIVNDVTIEKLQVLMAENPHGLLYYRDELTGLFTTMGKQGHETDRKFFLECWTGLHPYRIGRMGRDDVDIPRACLSIFGTIQPGPLYAYLKGSISGREADGFMPRFQMLVYPDPYPEFTYVDDLPNGDAKDRAFKVFQAINDLDPAALKCSPDDDLKIPFIGFDDEAQEFFKNWLTELETRLRKESMPPMMESTLAKYRKLMPSLSLLIHLANLVNAEGKIVALPPISVKAAGLAAMWCTYLEAHARRLYQAVSEGDPEDARHLWSKIGLLPNPFKFRDVQRRRWSGLGTNDDVRNAIGMLEDRGYVKVVTVERPGAKDEELIWVNPHIPRGSEADALIVNSN